MTKLCGRTTLEFNLYSFYDLSFFACLTQNCCLLLQTHDEMKFQILKALDVEVHRSNLDQRLYVVDCSRVMPASAICRDPAYRGHCNHLTMLLRPEIVRFFPRPLCNDAFSSFLLPKAILKRAIVEQQLRRSASGEGRNVVKLPLDASGKINYEGVSDGESLNEYVVQYLDSTPADTHKKNAYSGAYSREDFGYDLSDEDNQLAYAVDGLESYEDGNSTSENSIQNAAVPHAPHAPLASSNASHPGQSLRSSQFSEEEADYEQLLVEMEVKKLSFEEDITAATVHLRNVIIPKFAEELEKIFTVLPPVQQCAFAYDWIVVLLHWHGINIRHLGAVRACIRPENATLRSLLLNLMVSRVLKNMSQHRLRMKMRELRYAGEVPYQQCLVSFINLVFGTSTESLSFWNMHIKHALAYQFPDGLTAEEKNADLKTLVLDRPIIALDDLKTSLRESAARQGSNPFISTRNTTVSSPTVTSSPPALEVPSRTSSSSSSTTSVSLPPTPVFTRPMLHRTSEKSDPEISVENDGASPVPTDGTSSGISSSPNVSQVFKTPSKALRASRDENVAKVMQELPMDPVCFLFFNFCRLIGLKLKAGHMGSFASNPGLFQVAEPVNVLDLDGAPEKVKTLQVVSLAEGQVWKVRAEAASSLPKSKQFAFDLWKLALEAYKDSLLANPRDQRTLRNAAEVYHAIGLLELAGVIAHLAIETNPDDSVSLYKYATYLWSSTANPERAKRYFEAAIRAPNVTPGAILAYSAFEVQRHNIQDAVNLVKRCLEKFPKSWDAHFKMANLLQYHLKDYPKALIYYKAALDMESDDLVLLRHFVALLHKIEPVDTSLIATYELYIKKLEQKANIAGHRTKTFYSNLIVPSSQHLPTETEPDPPPSPVAQASSSPDVAPLTS